MWIVQQLQQHLKEGLLEQLQFLELQWFVMVLTMTLDLLSPLSQCLTVPMHILVLLELAAPSPNGSDSMEIWVSWSSEP